MCGMNKKKSHYKYINKGIFLCFIYLFIFMLYGCGQSKKKAGNYNPYFISEPTHVQLNLQYTYVRLGKYPQTRIKKSELNDEIINLDYDENEIGVYGSQKIFRKKNKDTYDYYMVEDILWRVIECDEDKVVLWSDCIIDTKEFSADYDETTELKWSESGLRYWLNNVFFEKIFSEKERKSIISQKYENYSSEFGYPMGEKERERYIVDITEDMVSVRDYYSLTLFEYDCPYTIKGKENQKVCPDISLYLECENTDYAMDRYMESLDENETYYEKYIPGYWTRTPISQTSYLEYISMFRNGAQLLDICDLEQNINHCKKNLGIRPVIVIKKSDLDKYLVVQSK